MRVCQNIDELVQMAYDNLQVMSPRDVGAFWTIARKFLTDQRRRSSLQAQRGQQLKAILDRTLAEVIRSDYRSLSQTAIALSKIIAHMESQRERPRHGTPNQLRHIFVGNQSRNKELIMKELALAAMPLRKDFPPRELSNLIYAFGLAKYVLENDDGSTTFDVLAKEALSNLKKFIGQDFSNMLWAYANAEVSNPTLFQASADIIAARDSLESFKPQELSNTVWAYATANESHPKLFNRVADHIVSLDLRPFNPQNLANTVWAYATAKESHPKLFERVADHIVTLDLRPFDPQALSNIVWAFATAKESHPKLFNRVADHIVSLDNMRSFNPQNLSNTVWAYATAGESHPELFRKVADVAMQRKDEYNEPQHIANLLWAFATIGELDRHLFETFASTAACLVDRYTEQELANIAWAYAVANVDAPALFNDAFINACIENESDFILEELHQLHQWNLWQEELKSSTRLPPTLEKRCRDAFISQKTRSSALQDDVISVLSSIGLNPEEEYLTELGYSLDALVEVNGSKVGVEVDGPSHFVGRNPTGSTLIKRRQVAALEGIPVVSVPYWEWDKLGKNREKKQDYLRALVGL